MPNPEATKNILNNYSPVSSFGKISKVVGLVAESSGIKAPLGSICHILPDETSKQPYSTNECPGSFLEQHSGSEACGIPVEVVGFRDGKLLLMPYGDLRGVRPGSLVRNSSTPPLFPVGKQMLGKALDAFGNPLNAGDMLDLSDMAPLYAQPPSPLSRPRISEPLDVGVRAINSLLTIGKGQRMGIMAGSGVGKSTLMGMMARYTKADVNVIGLIGERGREVLEFMEKDLGEEGMARSVLIVATTDQSPLVRMRAAYAATAVAEYFRDQGADVLFMMDSVTRFAMAAREVGLATGEPPTTKGYTPSVFTQLPKLLERSGRSSKGTITGIYTVLVDGDDFNEPVADSVRSILDGHIVLTRELADQGHFPAIDVLRSISRVRPDIITPEANTCGRTVLSHMATYKRVEDMINIGAYVPGSSQEIDAAIKKLPAIRKFLQQEVSAGCPLADSFKSMGALVSE